MNYTLTCLQCDKEYQTKCILQDFCSKECENNYWANPQKIEISTKCPTCKKDWSRIIDMTQLRGYQHLLSCSECSKYEPSCIVSISHTPNYIEQNTTNNDNVEEVCEKIFDGYPLIYHLAKGRS